MKSVKVRVAEVIPILKSNLETHRKDYEESLKGYQIKGLERLQEHIDELVQNPTLIPHWDLLPPETHVKDYDQAIRMFELSADEIVELTYDEFKRYVMDEWTWKAVFETSKRAYQSK